MSAIDLTHSLVGSPVVFHVNAENLTQTLNGSDDLYEMTFYNEKKCRAYIDIDGKMAPNTDELDFDMKNDAILQAINECDFGTPFSICTSSKYNNKNWNTTKKCSDKITHKLSYNLVFYERYGSCSNIKQWIETEICPILKRELSDIIPFFTSAKEQSDTRYDYLDYDNGVYRINGKMRALFSTKPTEQRPKTLYSQATILDTMITYVPKECQEIVIKPKTLKKEPILKDTIATPEISITTHNILIEVVDGLALHRWNNYNDFIHIGMACFNEKLSLDVWKRNASKGYKNKPTDCATHWSNFKQGGFTAKTLWAMLKEDNPTLFNSLVPQRSDIEKLMVDFTHYNVARHFFNTYPNDYLIDKGGWWGLLPSQQWTGPSKEPPITMKLKISRAIYSDLIEQDKFYTNAAQLLLSADNDKKQDLEHIRNQQKCNNTCKKNIQTDSFIKGVIALLGGFYSEETLYLLNLREKTNIMEVMDCNPYLWVFKDSVYDLRTETKGNRPIDSTDYVSIHCGYSYPTSNTKVREEILNVLNGMFDDDDTVKYLLTNLAGCVCGVRNAEAYFILSGKGRNGKGLLFEMIQRVFGTYYCNLPITVLTTRLSDSTSATPLIAGLRGKRMVVSSEPEANVKLEEGTLKGMTGGDPLTGRALYGEPITFKPQFGGWLQCNIWPKINRMTKAGAMRLRIINFPFIFVDNPIESHHRKSNPNVKNVLAKSDAWRDELCLMLFDYFELARDKAIDAIPTPIKVQESTGMYVAENNKVGSWWMENYSVGNPNDFVLSRDSLLNFNTMNECKMNPADFKNALEFNDIEIIKNHTSAFKGLMGIKGWILKEIHIVV